jgi:hypothetical protein
MSSRLSRSISLALRGRTVQVHSGVIRLPILATIALRRTNVHRWPLWHLRAGSQSAGGQLGSDTLNTQFNSLMDALLNLLGHITTRGLLLLLGSVHLFNFLLSRYDLFAIQSNSA